MVRLSDLEDLEATFRSRASAYYQSDDTDRAFDEAAEEVHYLIERLREDAKALRAARIAL